MTPSPDMNRLLAIMAVLRAPEGGCPWDIEQDFASIAPYTIEEAYEVADAIRRGDMPDLKDELGDLLLQVVFHARIAEELGAFSFPDVVLAITTKLIRRHPHVFGDKTAGNPASVKTLWDDIKRVEKRERAAARKAAGLPEEAAQSGLLAGVKPALPGFLRAIKLQQKAASVGFDWAEARLVLAKIREEVDEAEAALAAGDQNAIEDEIGDLLFAAVNLARHARVEPETALQRTNDKFQRSFGFIEAALAEEGRSLGEASLDEMEALWVKAKQK